MLTEDQIAQLWESMLAAEVRGLYFGDLATRFTRRKQGITGLTFFLTSGAAATAIAKLPPWVTIVLTLIAAALNAYAIAVALDGKIANLAKLHATWTEIAYDYRRLWNHAYEADAEAELSRIAARETAPSELALTAAPYDEALLGHWQDRVLSMRHLTPTAA